jgi:uncharacterized integral membrane protein
MARLIFKTAFVIALLMLLVIMGMNNLQTVELTLPPLLTKAEKQPAAIRYFGFFAVGLLAGVVLTAGKSSKSKSE